MATAGGCGHGFGGEGPSKTSRSFEELVTLGDHDLDVQHALVVHSGLRRRCSGHLSGCRALGVIRTHSYLSQQSYAKVLHSAQFDVCLRQATHFLRADVP